MLMTWGGEIRIDNGRFGPRSNGQWQEIAAWDHISESAIHTAFGRMAAA